MKVSYKAYELIRAKYLAKGKIISDEGCIAYRETIVKGTEHQYTIYEELYSEEEYDELYISIYEDDNLIEQYEVRV